MSSSARRVAVEYDAPVGLFGSMIDHRARRRRDELAQFVDVGRPSACRIAAVVAGPGPELGQHRRVERIGRHRHQHFALLVDQRGERKVDRFRRAGGDEDAIARDRETARREFLGDRFARRGDPRRGAVAVVPVAHRALDRGDEVRRRLEPEGDRVADIQVADPRSLRFDALGLGDDVADGVREAVDAVGDRNGAEESACWSHGQSYRGIAQPGQRSSWLQRSDLSE